MAAAWMNHSWLVTNLTTLPAPRSPQSITVPRWANTGRTRSVAAGSTTHEQGQGAPPGPIDCTGDRGVDHVDAGRRPLGQGADEIGPVGGQVDPDRTRPKGGEGPGLDHDRFDVVGVRQRREEQLDPAGELGRPGCGLGPDGHRPLDGLRVEIEHDDPVTGPDKVGAHRPTHRPQADEADRSHAGIVGVGDRPVEWSIG